MRTQLSVLLLITFVMSVHSISEIFPPCWQVSGISSIAAHPELELSCPVNTTLVDGSCYVEWDGFGNMLTQHDKLWVEEDDNTYKCKSKDQGQSSPAYIRGNAYCCSEIPTTCHWIRNSTSPYNYGSTVATCAANETAVSGGCTSYDWTHGALLYADYNDGDSHHCSAKSHGTVESFSLNASALCCEDEDIGTCYSYTSTSNTSSNPHASVMCGSGEVAFGGGCKVNPSVSGGIPNALLTANDIIYEHGVAVGRYCESKDHLTSYSHNVTAQVTCCPE